METTNLIRAMLAGLVIVSGLLLSSCGGGGDTASGGGVDFASSLAVSSTRSKNNVGTEFNASYVATKVRTGDPATRITVTFILSDINGNFVGGVIRWGDGNEDPIFGQGVIAHIFNDPGNYVFIVAPDGEESFVVGGRKVLPLAPAPAPVVVEEEDSTPPATVDNLAGFTCMPAAGSGIDTSDGTSVILPNPIPGGFVSISITANLGALCAAAAMFGPLVLSPGLSVIGSPSDRSCMVGDTFTITLTALAPNAGTATCSWPVVSSTAP